jgi:predicted Zn-dependent protease
MLRTVRFVSLALAAALALAACEQAPITGRSRVAPLASQHELALQAEPTYRQEMATNPLSRDPAVVERVRRVGQRIANAAENPPAGQWTAPGFQWEFNVIADSRTLNAYCMPGGKIAVYTGILAITEDDDSLAVLMGHEVAHALQNHHGERLANQQVVGTAIQVAGAVVGALLGGRSNRVAGMQSGMQLAGVGNQLLQLSFSRDQESEADRVGLILAASAGYDPSAAVGLWERMKGASRSGGRPPEFLSSHPSPDTRIEDIRKHLHEAMGYYKPRR